MEEAAPCFLPLPHPESKLEPKNARMPVKQKEKALLQPRLDISMQASSPAPRSRAAGILSFCSMPRFCKECVRVDRITRPDEQRWFPCRQQHLIRAGEKRHCQSRAFLLQTCSPRSRAESLCTTSLFQ